VEGEEHYREDLKVWRCSTKHEKKDSESVGLHFLRPDQRTGQRQLSTGAGVFDGETLKVSGRGGDGKTKGKSWERWQNSSPPMEQKRGDRDGSLV